MRPKIIVIEGSDGSGKSTQMKMLTEYFTEQERSHKYIHFPGMDGCMTGDLIRQFLEGEFGSVKAVHPKLVALMYAHNRNDYKHVLTDPQCEFILLDRYVYSNVIYQCAKIHNNREKLELQQWILDYEFGHLGLPRPDINIYLDVPFETSDLVLKQRDTSDIHESDIELQYNIRVEGKRLVDTRYDFTTVTCYDENNKWRSVKEIHTQIVSAIFKRNLL